jgi:hypothetical protein
VSVESENGYEAGLIAANAAPATKSGTIAYAEWLSDALTHRSAKAPLDDVADFFISAGIGRVLHCSPEKVKEWVAQLSGLVKTKSPGKLAFTLQTLETAPWPGWFDEPAKVVVLLAVFLRHLPGNWHCQIDAASLDRLKDVNPRAGPIAAAVFARGFGLADAVPSEELPRLIQLLEGFIVGTTIANEITVLSRVKTVALKGFQLHDLSRNWIGQGLVLLSMIHEFTYDHATLGKRLLEACGDPGWKAEIYRAERICLPVIICLSQRQDGMMKLSNQVRDAIGEVRKTMR